MNIDFVDKVILRELDYNNAAMTQYYFRFIRYISKHFKNVYFLTYEKSIEMNLLKMVLSKEKINLFMKKQGVGDGELMNILAWIRKCFRSWWLRKRVKKDVFVCAGGEQKISGWKSKILVKTLFYSNLYDRGGMNIMREQIFLYGGKQVFMPVISGGYK